MGSARIVLVALPLLACEQLLDLDAYGLRAGGGSGGVGGVGGAGGTGEGGSAGIPNFDPPAYVWHHVATGDGDRTAAGSARAADGTFYLAGTVIGTLDDPETPLGSESYDAFLVKLTEAHTVEWSRVYASDSTQNVDDLAVDGANNAVIGGWLNGPMDLDGTPIDYAMGDGTDAWIAKIGSDASVVATHRLYGTGDQVLWSLDYDNHLFLSAHNGGAMNVAGEVVNAGGEPPDAVVARLESGADWADQYGGDVEQTLLDVSTSASAVVSVGTSSAPLDFVPAPKCDTNGGGRDVLIAVSPLDGGASWSRCYGAGGDQVAWGVFARDVPDEYILVGTFAGTLDFMGATGELTATDQSDGFVAKIGAGGLGIWAVSIGGDGNQLANRVTEDADGNIWVVGDTYGPLIVGGETHDSQDAEDGFIVRLAQDGTVTWVGVVGGVGNQALWQVSPTPSGVLISGTVSGNFNLFGISIAGDTGYDALVFELE